MSINSRPDRKIQWAEAAIGTDPKSVLALFLGHKNTIGMNNNDSQSFAYHLLTELNIPSPLDIINLVRKRANGEILNKEEKIIGKDVINTIKSHNGRDILKEQPIPLNYSPKSDVRDQFTQRAIVSSYGDLGILTYEGLLSKIEEMVLGEDTEDQDRVFCGMHYNELHDLQQKLFRILSPQQRKEISEQTSICSFDGQKNHSHNHGFIEFNNIDLAIRDGHKSGDHFHKSDVGRIIDKYKSSGRRLPTQEDFDKMIAQMPSEDLFEREEYFKLMTFYNTRYCWVVKPASENGGADVLMALNFSKDTLSQAEEWDHYAHIFLVKNL